MTHGLVKTRYLEQGRCRIAGARLEYLTWDSFRTVGVLIFVNHLTRARREMSFEANSGMIGDLLDAKKVEDWVLIA